MITKLTLGNYRSLGSWVEIPLEPLTVLVGSNGAGKSNVADALRFVGDAVRDGLEHAVASRQGFGSVRRWSKGGLFDVSVMLEVRLGAVEWRWAVVLTADRTSEFRVKREGAIARASRPHDEVIENIARAHAASSVDDGEPTIDWEESALCNYYFNEGTWRKPPRPDLALTPPPRSLLLPEIAKLDPRFKPLADHLAGLMVYSLFPPMLRLPQASDPTRPMRRQGENWATHLRALDRDTQGAELLAGLGRVVGDIDDYKVSAVGGFLIPEFRHGNDGDRERWFGAAQESDGTLRMAGILTALLQSPSPSLIGIAAVLTYREYETMFLASLASLAGKPLVDPNGVKRAGIVLGAVYEADPQAKRDAKAVVTSLMPAGRTYKPTTDQLALTRHLDFALLRASGLPCFGTLERALRFLAIAPPGEVHPPAPSAALVSPKPG